MSRNSKREEFFLDRDPLDDSKIDPPIQLDLKQKPKPDTFTRNANALIARHKKGLGK